MPTELRKLVFSNDELKEAIILYNQIASEKLPAGDFLSCDVEKNSDEISVVIRISETKTGANQRIVLASAFIGACLVNFCRQKRIPLPRDGVKALQVVGDNIALNVNKQLAERKLFQVEAEEAAASEASAEAPDAAD